MVSYTIPHYLFNYTTPENKNGIVRNLVSIYTPQLTISIGIGIGFSITIEIIIETRYQYQQQKEQNISLLSTTHHLEYNP